MTRSKVLPFNMETIQFSPSTTRNTFYRWANTLAMCHDAFEETALKVTWAGFYILTVSLI